MNTTTNADPICPYCSNPVTAPLIVRAEDARIFACPVCKKILGIVGNAEDAEAYRQQHP